MKRRKRSNVIETGVQLLPRGQVWRVPAYWPDGDRRKGGASSV